MPSVVAATAVAALVAAAVVVLVALAVYQAGWDHFRFEAGANPAWPRDQGGRPLKFSRVTFYLYAPGGGVYQADVTGRMNALASAYAAEEQKPPMQLLRPLGPYSFVVPGANDGPAREWLGAVLDGYVRYG